MTASLPHDTWYAVGGSETLAPGAACAVSLFDRDIALWRGRSGRFHAWDNRCVHRGMRLSFGRVRGDRLICAYHGWNYDEDGRCCFIPARPNMTPSEKITSPRHKSVDRDGLLWVGLNDVGETPPDLANLDPHGRAFAFVQSLALPEPAEALEARLRRAVFPPCAIEAEYDGSQPWRYRVESVEGDTMRVRWCRAEDERVVAYRAASPYPGILVITARMSDLRETRLFALQPRNDEGSALHLMIATDGTEAEARPIAARWGRRLRWFLDGNGADTQAYRPWFQQEDPR